jgi:hypothetical protein
MVEIDLSSADLGRVANQDVDMLMIANQIVWQVSEPDGPYYLNDALTVTPTAYTDGTPNIVIGHPFLFAVPGFVTGVRWYDGASGAGSWILSIWDANTSDGARPNAGSSTRLASKTVSAAGGGYRDTNFDSPVAVTTDNVYVVSRYNSAGHYVHSPAFNGPHGAYTDPDPVYLPVYNGDISAIVAGWTAILPSIFSIGGGDVIPVSDGSSAHYGLTPIFFKTL